MSPGPQDARRPRVVVALAALAAVLALAVACGGGGSAGGDTASASGAGDSHAGTTTGRSVVERSLPPSVCPAPTTPPHGVTTTAAAPGSWPPPGYDPSALVRADVLSWSDGKVHLRWQPGQGVGSCEVDLAADIAWVLGSSGYREIRGADIGAFVSQRLADLGGTASGVPFLVEVSDDGRTARQLGEIPPG